MQGKEPTIEIQGKKLTKLEKMEKNQLKKKDLKSASNFRLMQEIKRLHAIIREQKKEIKELKRRAK